MRTRTGTGTRTRIGGRWKRVGNYQATGKNSALEKGITDCQVAFEELLWSWEAAALSIVARVSILWALQHMWAALSGVCMMRVGIFQSLGNNMLLASTSFHQLQKPVAEVNWLTTSHLVSQG